MWLLILIGDCEKGKEYLIDLIHFINGPTYSKNTSFRQTISFHWKRVVCILKFCSLIKVEHIKTHSIDAHKNHP